MAGKRDHLGIHNSGNVVVVKDPDGVQHPDEVPSWILIDGQQRMTTTSLLVAAIRDALMEEGFGSDNDVVQTLERILYIDSDKARMFQGEDLEEGCDLSFCRLLPSFYDRRPFFLAIMEGFGTLDKSHLDEELKKDSLQVKAKRYFDHQIKLRLDSVCGVNNKQARYEELKSLAHLTLTKMGLTLAEVLNKINLAQVFLWLQEKSLFGEGALLFNPSPGIDFTASDLIRNLILASVARKTLKEQEDYYRAKWLNPLESKNTDMHSLTRKIASFVKDSTDNINDVHVSKLEETVLQVRKQFPKAPGVLDHAMEYGKFYSLYEWRLRQAAMLPPRTVKKFTTKMPKNHEEGPKEKDLTELVDEETMQRVTDAVLEQLAAFEEKNA